MEKSRPPMRKSRPLLRKRLFGKILERGIFPTVGRLPVVFPLPSRSATKETLATSGTQEGEGHGVSIYAEPFTVIRWLIVDCACSEGCVAVLVYWC